MDDYYEDDLTYIIVFEDDDPAVIEYLRDHAETTTGPKFPVVMTVEEFKQAQGKVRGVWRFPAGTAGL